ncbi:MAG: hypothetical protein WBD01_07180, partial [Salaquimonas sp.]
ETAYLLLKGKTGQGKAGVRKMKHTYANLFIDLAKYSIATVVIVAGFVTTATIASSRNTAPSQTAETNVTSAQLAIKSPRLNVCPSSAKMSGWIHTNQPGKISYVIAKKDGALMGPYTLEAVKSVNGGMASFSTELEINDATETEYQIQVAHSGAKTVSQWTPLKARCQINLAG